MNGDPCGFYLVSREGVMGIALVHGPLGSEEEVARSAELHRRPGKEFLLMEVREVPEPAECADTEREGDG